MLADSGHQKEVATSTPEASLSIMTLRVPSKPRRQVVIIRSILKWGNKNQKGTVTCPKSHSQTFFFFLSLQHPCASGVGRGSAEGRLFKLSLRGYIGFFRKRRVGLAGGKAWTKVLRLDLAGAVGCLPIWLPHPGGGTREAGSWFGQWAWELSWGLVLHSEV